MPIHSLKHFLDLLAGWDSYNARPISPAAVASLEALLALAPSGWQVVPVASGGLQAEWYTGGRFVEVGTEEAGTFWVMWGEDSVSPVAAWDARKGLTTAEVLTMLREVLGDE